LTLYKDPEKRERKILLDFASFNNKRVLEIGCGEGRLTWQYADASHWTLGLDTDHDALRIALADRPSKIQQKVHFTNAQAEHLPFRKETFDLAILAWSL